MHKFFLKNRFIRQSVIIGAMLLVPLLGILIFQPNQETTSRASLPATIAAALPINPLANQPLRFIENQGQAGVDAKYHVQGAGHTVLFYEEKIVLRRTESATAKNEIALKFDGANPTPVVAGVEKLAGVAHFYKGSDPNTWQTNVPTYGAVMYKELYTGIAVGDSATAFLFGVWGDTIRVYEKAEGDSLKPNFAVAAPGHGINAVQYSNGFLAFAGTFFPPGLNKTNGFGNNSRVESAHSESGGTAGLLNLFASFDTQLIDGLLSIKLKKDGKMKLGRDTTINGVSTNIKADDVEKIEVFGSDGIDEIDLWQATLERFSNINIPALDPEVVIHCGDGNDTATAGRDFKSEIFGGKKTDFVEGGAGDDEIDGDDFLNGGRDSDKVFGGLGDDSCFGDQGDDEVHGGEGDDRVSGEMGKDKLFGEKGEDKLFADKNDEIVSGGFGDDRTWIGEEEVPQSTSSTNNDSINKYAALGIAQNAVTITDSTGVDTLDFSGSESGITLNLSLLDSAQTIDSSGTQVILQGVFEIIIGSNFADVAYANIETVNLSFVSGVSEADTPLPAIFRLHHNYPNPFNPETTIRYDLPAQADVRLTIFDVLGRAPCAPWSSKSRPPACTRQSGTAETTAGCNSPADFTSTSWKQGIFVKPLRCCC